MLDAGSVLASASDCIKIWDAAGDNLHLNTLYTKGTSTFKDVSWNLNNTRLASISNGNGIYVYNFQEGVKSDGRILSDSKEQNAVCFGATKDELYSGCATGDINQWNCNTFELTKTYSSAHASAVTRLTRMGDRLVSASADGHMYIWKTSDSSVLAQLNSPKPKPIRGLGHSRYDKTLLGTTSDEGVVSLWDVEKQTIKHNFTSHGAPAMDLSFSTINALLLVSGGLDKKIIFYDAQARDVVKTVTCMQPVTAVCFLGNGMHVCAGTSMGNILLYDLRHKSDPFASLHAHSTSVQRLVLQTMKERKRSSRASTTKTSEKRSSRTKAEGTSKHHTNTNQEHTSKTSTEAPQKRLPTKSTETVSTNDVPKSNADRAGNASLKNTSTGNPVLPILQTPVNHGTHYSRDTIGSYCEQQFSPLGSISGSIHMESTPFVQSKSKELGNVNSIRLNSPLLHSTSRITNGSAVNGVGPSSVRTPNGAIHATSNSVGDFSSKPVLSSTPAEAPRATSLQHIDDTAASSQNNNPSTGTSSSTLVTGTQNINPSAAQSLTMPFQYQLDFLKNTVHDLIDDHEENMRDHLRHMHLQIIKMFAEQNEVIRQLAEQCSVNPLLLQEIERLRTENDRLRRNF